MKDKVVCTSINAFQYMIAAVSVDDVFRWIELGLAILCSCVLLAYRVWRWYKDAKQDGKITAEEVKNVIEENKDDVQEIVDQVEDLVDDIKSHKATKDK